MTRISTAAISSDSDCVVTTDGAMVRVAGGRALMDATTVIAAAVLEHAVWLVTHDPAGHTLHRFHPSGVPAAPPTPLGALGDRVTIAVNRIGSRVALLEGARAVLVRERDGEVVLEELGERRRDRRVLVGTRGVAERSGATLRLRSGTLPPLEIPSDLRSYLVGTAAVVHDGNALLVELVGNDLSTALVYDLRSGQIAKRIRLGELRILSIAERAGLVVLGRGTHVALLDLRAGRCISERILARTAVGAAIDASGTKLVLVDTDGNVTELDRALTDRDAGLPVVGAELAELGRGSGPDVLATVPVPARDVEELARLRVEATDGGDDLARGSSPALRVHELVAPAGGVGRRPELDRFVVAHGDGRTEVGPAELARGSNPDLRVSLGGHRTRARRDASQPVLAARPAAARDGAHLTFEAVPAALHASEQPPTRRARYDAPAHELSCELLALGEPRADRDVGGDALATYLTDALTWIDAMCATAQAIARGDEALVDEVRKLELAAADTFARWNCRGAPHIELVRELGLSALAGTMLLIIAAPQIWGELARAYHATSADPARPLVDELLLAQLLEADVALRTAMATELDAGAPLVRHGAIEVGGGLRPYASLSVHPAVARRLAGIPRARAHGPALAEVVGPRAAIAGLVASLAAPRSEPVRVVLRGRRGMGRRTLAGALARQAGRAVARVDAAPTATLAMRLAGVALRGGVPCLDLDDVSDEPAARTEIRAIVDAHAGPLFIRAPRHGELPLTTGAELIELADLDETTRREVWSGQLAGHGLATPDIALVVGGALAARCNVGPGPIVRACAKLAADHRAAGRPDTARPASDTASAGALEAALAGVLRSYRSTRIAAIAERVDALATWEQLVVPPDIEEALHELVARVRHRRTVLETWGLSRVATTAGAVTALFQGGPGTGKTMAAGVIAAALGYELWRIDLSKVMSKWVGETEKHLAAVFDAAEEGEIVLLFDEADSLFAKRSDARSGGERHGNVATNYLLQRLDAFTGIAILTTNFGTAIDPAFKRRLSMQVEFPFPDEDDRERLWHAHLPPSLPTAGDLHVGALARQYQLSGGYIRNAVLRAAYLAAARGGEITAAHLVRAVVLEKERIGKLGDGRLE